LDNVSKKAGREVDRQEVGLMTYWRQWTVHWDSCCSSQKTAKHVERWSIQHPTIST